MRWMLHMASTNKTPGAHQLRAYNLQLQRVLAGQLIHEVQILFAVELILHGQHDNTHQRSQQNPHHNCYYLPTIMAYIVQENLQNASFDSYYTHPNQKIKMTMQEIMKKCFSAVLAF